jgi:hypothetical protein
LLHDALVALGIGFDAREELGGRHADCFGAGALDEALGGEISIPTLDGSAKIRVPAETQTGKTFRLKAKGIKAVLLREFDTISAQDSARHSPRAKGWFDKVTEFFEG